MDTTEEIVNAYAKRTSIRDWKTSKSSSNRSQIKGIGNQNYKYYSGGIIVYESVRKVYQTPIVLDQQVDAPFHAPQPVYEPINFQFPTDSTLSFDSQFECGNLKRAVKISDSEYKLWLNSDYGSDGHTMWYYFSVKSYQQNHKVRFYIENWHRPDSLYKNGMKPSVQCNGAWVSWDEVLYYSTGDSYLLSFAYTFKEAEQVVYFSHWLPYSHTQLMRYWETLPRKIARVDTLCLTLGGNICPVITITNDVAEYESWESESSKMAKTSAARRLLRTRTITREYETKRWATVRGKRVRQNKHKRKKGMIITARVHPSESNSSYVMKGVIDFLTSNSREARVLRKHYVFKIVPMLNPDGVIYGNSRWSLLGVDLNRRWNKPDKKLHPTIFWAKRLFQVFTEEHEPLLYIDLHGHSSQFDTFMYCNNKQSTDFLDQKNNVLIRLIPHLLSQRNPNFWYKYCRFRTEKCKENTARVVMYKEFDIVNSYTLETSMHGTEKFAFRATDLYKIGEDLWKVFWTFVNQSVFRNNLEQVKSIITNIKKLPISEEKDLEELEHTERPCEIDQLHEQIEKQPELIDKMQGEDPESAGSESEDALDDETEEIEATLPDIASPPPQLKSEDNTIISKSPQQRLQSAATGSRLPHTYSPKQTRKYMQLKPYTPRHSFNETATRQNTSEMMVMSPSFQIVKRKVIKNMRSVPIRQLELKVKAKKMKRFTKWPSKLVAMGMRPGTPEVTNATRWQKISIPMVKTPLYSRIPSSKNAVVLSGNRLQNLTLKSLNMEKFVLKDLWFEDRDKLGNLIKELAKERALKDDVAAQADIQRQKLRKLQTKQNILLHEMTQFEQRYIQAAAQLSKAQQNLVTQKENEPPVKATPRFSTKIDATTQTRSEKATQTEGVKESMPKLDLNSIMRSRTQPPPSTRKSSNAIPENPTPGLNTEKRNPLLLIESGWQSQSQNRGSKAKY